MTKKPYTPPQLTDLDPDKVRHALAADPVKDERLEFVFMGHRNPVNCMWALVSATEGLTADEESFREVAEIVGDAPPEVLANGFICENFSEAMPVLASIANIRVIGDNGTIRVELLPDDPRAR